LLSKESSVDGVTVDEKQTVGGNKAARFEIPRIVGCDEEEKAQTRDLWIP
jgi:hypothetical protein